MQAWNQFPAGKWGVEPVPTSSLPVDTAHDDASYQQQNTADTPHHATDISAPTHGDALNDGTKQVPWVLEKPHAKLHAHIKRMANDATRH